MHCADVAWYEGRYPSALAAPGQQAKRGTSRRAALAVTDTGELAGPLFWSSLGKYGGLLPPLPGFANAGYHSGV